MMKYYVGIDIGGTTIKYGLVDEKGTVIENDLIKTIDDKKTILELIYNLVLKYQKKYDVSAVGVSVPGFVTRNGFLKTAGAIKSLYKINLKEELEEKLSLLVYVENDANSAALAENWVGKGNSVKDFVFISVGTGIGGAIIVDNSLLKGYMDRAGEFGFMIINPVIQDDTKSPSLSKVGAIPSLLDYYFIQTNSRVSDAKAIFELVEKGDEFAIAAINRFTFELAIGLYNLTICLDPQVLVIGGAISENKIFINKLQDQLLSLMNGHNEMRDEPIPQIVAAKHLNLSGIIGSVYPAVHK